MALALNNLKRVDMPLNKEIKPNQISMDLIKIEKIHIKKDKNRISAETVIDYASDLVFHANTSA